MHLSQKDELSEYLSEGSGSEDDNSPLHRQMDMILRYISHYQHLIGITFMWNPDNFYQEANRLIIQNVRRGERSEWLDETFDIIKDII